MAFNLDYNKDEERFADVFREMQDEELNIINEFNSMILKRSPETRKRKRTTNGTSIEMPVCKKFKVI